MHSIDEQDVNLVTGEEKPNLEQTMRILDMAVNCKDFPLRHWVLRKLSQELGIPQKDLIYLHDHWRG